MKKQMRAIKSIELPFVTINKGEVVEVTPTANMFGQDMSCVGLKTPLGEMGIHLPTSSLDSLFEEVGTEKPEQLDSLWIEQLLSKLGGVTDEKPHVKVATSPTKYFVIKDLHPEAKVGAIVTVTGHLADGGVTLTLPTGVQAKCSKAFFNHVIPTNEQKASINLDGLKRKHYLSQGFLSSGGLLVKRIDGRQAQVIKEENLDVVRVLIDNKLSQVIMVDWES